MTTDEPEQLRAARYNSTVTYIRKVHSDLMVLRVRPDGPRSSYLAGQYCALGLGYWEPRVDGCQSEDLKPDDQVRVVRRSYSVSSSVLDDSGHLRDMAADDWVEFYIVLVRESAEGRVPALTPRLFALKEGDRLSMGEKFVGHFTSQLVKPTDNVVLLGTGTGEAPHNSIIWDLLRRGHEGKIVHANCVRHHKDLGYSTIHETLMAKYQHYKYIGLATREPSNHGRKVYIQDCILSGQIEECLGAKLDPANTHVFLCGNPSMIGVPVKDKATGVRSYPEPRGVIEILESRGFQADNAAAKLKGNIHFEEYW